MYIISLTLQRTVDVTVRNSHSFVELVSPVYFCNHGTCYEYPVERTDHDAITKISFRFDFNQHESGGILMYKAQRKVDAGSDHQSSIDKVIEDTLNMMQLLVIWKTKDLEEPQVIITLLEHDNEHVLDEDKLAQLYNKMIDIPFIYCYSHPHQPTINFYSLITLVCIHRILYVAYKTEWKGILKLEMKVFGNDYTTGYNEYAMKPMWMDPKR
jgi:hypothetical protein